MVSNVANFGAFVDVGVHQDGLVHISAITNKFISDPREVVKAGDIVKVKVVEVDAARKRISFTMRLDDDIDTSNKSAAPATQKPQARANNSQPRTAKPKRDNGNALMGNAFADAFANAKVKK